MERLEESLSILTRKREQLLRELFVLEAEGPEGLLDYSLADTKEFEEYKTKNQLTRHINVNRASTPSSHPPQQDSEEDVLFQPPKLTPERSKKSPSPKAKTIASKLHEVVGASSLPENISPIEKVVESISAKRPVGSPVIKKRRLLIANQPSASSPMRLPLKLEPYDDLIVPVEKSNKASTITKSKSRLVPGIVSEPSDELKGYQLSAWQMKVHPSLLSSVLQPAKKVVTTKDWLLARDEYRQLKLHNKVENMKASNLWSFRQLQAHIPPPKPKTHHDFLIEEMKWMSEDFRQERKWKISAAYNMAKWVMEWHAAADKSPLLFKYKKADLYCNPPSPTRSEKFYDAKDVGFDGMEGIEGQNVEIIGDAAEKSKPDDEVYTSAAEDLMAIDVNPPSTSPSKNTSTVVNNETIPDNKPADNKLIPNDVIFLTTDLESNTYSTTKNEKTCTLKIDHKQSKIYKPFIDYPSNRSSTTTNTNIPRIEPPSRVIPVSRLNVERTFANISSQWDEYGRARNGSPWCTSGGSVPILPNDNKYETLPVTSLFSNKRSKKESEFPAPKSQPRADSTDYVEPPTWGAGEDECLQNSVKMFHYNWSLIAECLNSSWLVRNYRRTEIECYNRWISLKESSKNQTQPQPQSSGTLDNTAEEGQSRDLMPPPKPIGKKEASKLKAAALKSDRSRRLQELLSDFELMLKFAKKREPRPPVVNKKVNLAAHETHVASQTQAGVKVGAPPLGPIDISILKDLRDKEIERQKMEYSKLAAHAQQQAMGGRPIMPMGGIPMNYNCYGRPPVRPGGSPNIGAGQMMRGMPNGMNNEQMKQAIMARNYMARGMPFAGQNFDSNFAAAFPAGYPTQQQQQQRYPITSPSSNPSTPRPLGQQNSVSADLLSAAAIVALQNSKNATANNK